MKCPECGHNVPDGSAFCGDCGQHVQPGPGTRGEQAKPDAQALLLRANLLRVRGHWEAAAEHCAEVLKIDPRSASAYSLLGEIYDNQGRLDQAIRWYEEALELNPNSVADRAKLARARELHQARQRPARPIARPSFSWLRVAAFAGAIICLGIIVLAVLFGREKPGPPVEPPVSPPAALAHERPVNPLHWLTTQERDVGTRAALVLPPALQLGWLLIDPGDHSVLVGLALDITAYRAGGAGPQMASRLMRDGYRIAHHIHLLYPEAGRVDLRVAARTAGEGGPEMSYLFTGTLYTVDLGASPEVVTPADAARLYRRYWWNPAMSL